METILETSCFRCKKNTWNVESNYILQLPKYLIIVVNRFRYINNNFTKDRCSIPMDMTVVLGLHKFSKQATIDHHGPSMCSGYYTGVLDYLIMSGFRRAFSCMVQYSLCHGMDNGTCDIVHWSSTPHHRTAYWTVFFVSVVLVLNVIRYSCHYFLDIILYHHDFHHDSFDYHWHFIYTTL